MVQREEFASPAVVVSPVRIGGGYVIPETPESVEKMSHDTLDLLASQDKSYSSHDFEILGEIIQGAETSSAGKRVTLTKILKSYDRTLSGHGIDCEKDTRLYRFILKLSLDPNPDWWAKYDAEMCRLLSSQADLVDDEEVAEVAWGAWKQTAAGRGGASNEPQPTPALREPSISSNKVSSIVGRWKSTARERRHEREAKEKQEKEAAKVSAVVGRWKTTARERRQERVAKATSVAKRWKLNARERRVEREAVEQWELAVDFSRRKLLREVLQAWYLHDVLLLSKAMNLLRSSTLRHHFDAWAYQVHKFEIVCARHLEGREDRFASRVLREWRQVTRLSQLDKISALKALTYWSYNRINTCMGLWVRAVKERKKSLKRSDTVYDASLKIRALAAWRSQGELGRKAREARVLSERHLEGRTLAKWRLRFFFCTERKHRIEGCLMRMRVFKRRATFSAWRGEVDYKRMMRDTLEHGVLRVKGVKLLYALNAWRMWYSGRMEVKGKLLAFGEMVKYRVQLSAWNSWLAFHNSRIEKEEVLLSCLSYMLGQKSARIVSAWYGYTQRQIHLREIVQTLRGRIKSFNMEAVFSDWLGLVHATKDKLRRCAKALRARKLLYAFNGFCYVVSEMKIKRLKVKLCVKRLQKKEASKAMNTWIRHTKRSKHVKKVLAKSIEKTIFGRKMRFFAIWSSQVARMKVVKAKIMKAARFLINRRLAHHFERWRQLWIERLRERLSWMESRELIENQRLLRVFHKWILKKRKKDLTRKVLIHWQKALLSRCLMGWSTWSKTRAIKAKLMQTLIMKLKGNRCSHAFCAWMTYTRIKSRHRQIVESLRNKRVLHCFLLWKNTMLQTRYQTDQLQVIIMRWRKESLSRAFVGWVDGVVHSKEKRKQAKIALTYWLKRGMRKAFKSLRENALERRRAKYALTHLVFMSIAKAFRAWVYYIENKKRMARKGLKVIERMRVYGMRVAFDRWLLYIIEKEQERTRLENALACMRNSILKKGFASWLFRMEDKRNKLHNINVCVSFWRSRLKLMALRRWRERAEYQMHLEGVVRGCLVNLRNAALVKGLHGWLDYVSYAKEKKSNLVRALAFWRRQQISFFTLWKRYVDRKKANELRVRTNLKRLLFQRLFDMLIHWRSWMYKQHDKRRMMLHNIKHMTNRRLAKGFVAWRELIPWLVSKRKKARMAIGHWSLRIKLVFYLSWFNFTATMKMARVNERRSYLSKAMRAWVYACKRKIELAYILEVALMRWAHRETLGAWLKLKDNRIHSKLKRKAAAHFQSSRAASALRRWAEYVDEKAEKRRKADKAIRHLQNSRLASSFAGWHTRSVARQEQSALIEKSIQRWRKAQQRHYFAFLLDVTRERREVRRMAVMGMMHSRLAKSFHFWSDFAYWEPLVRRAVNHWKGHEVVKTFAKWCSYTSYRQAKLIGISHFQRSCRTKVVYLWIEYADRERRKKENTRRAMQLFCRGMYAKGFFSWKDRVRVLASNRDKISRSLSLIRRNERRRCLEKWRAHVHRTHQKGLASDHFRRTVRRSRLRMWVKNANFLRDRRQRCERLRHRATSRMRNLLSHQALDAWSAYSYRSRGLRRILHRVQKRRVVRALNSLVWYTDQQRKLRYAMARTFRKMLFRSFQGWSDRVSQKKQKTYVLQRRLRRHQGLVLQIVKRWSHMGLALPWSSWQAYVRARSYSRYAVRRAAHFHLSLIFHHWLRCAVRLRELRDSVESFLSSMSSRKGRTVLREWRQASVDRISRREMLLQRCVLAMQSNTLTKTVYAWRSWCTLKIQRRKKLRVALQYFATVSLCKTFAVWRDEVNLIVQLRQIYLQRQLAIRKAVRAGEAKIRRKRWELVAATFMAWKLRAGTYKKLKRYMEFRLRRTEAQVFNLWKSCSILSRFRREILHRILWNKFQCEVLWLAGYYFERWSAASRLVREEQAMMKSAAHHHRMHLLAAVWQHWKLSMICADPLSAIKRTPTKFVGNATPDHVMQSVRSLSELVDRPRSERLEPFLQLTQRRRGGESGRPARTPRFDLGAPGSADQETSTFPILNMQSMYTTPVMNQRADGRTPGDEPGSSSQGPRTIARSMMKNYFMADDNNWY